MKTIRRRAANPLLTWDSAGSNMEYRVVVRNQDTGERQAIYDGFHTQCRLPPDLRLTSDLLAYRVLARPVEDAPARFTRLKDYTPIARLGDDYETPADDLLVGPAIKGVSQYRLLVRNKATGRPVVDLVRNEPRFLLPPGQLREGEFEYDLTPRVQGRWKGRQGLPITAAMIAAADARAEAPVLLPPADPPRISGDLATSPPGRPSRLGPVSESAIGPRLLVAVDFTVAPNLAAVADPDDISSRQLWSGEGTGAVEGVALMLEAHELAGLFLVDVLAGEAIGYDLIGQVAATLQRRGHALALMINAEAWRGISPRLAAMSVQDATAEAFHRYHDLFGAPPEVLSFGRDRLDVLALETVRGLGGRVVIADRQAQQGLPAWMRWRTAPFAAYDNLAVLPSSMILSTPAHERDRVVTHALRAEDALTAGMAAPVAQALAETHGLLIGRINPLALLLRRSVRSAELAEAWNLELSERHPAWLDAGWDRSPKGFQMLGERDEIRSEMISSLLGGLAAAATPSADLATVFSPAALRHWCTPDRGFEPLVEHRRAPRLLRRSAVRRYDAALLQALKSGSS